MGLSVLTPGFSLKPPLPYIHSKRQPNSKVGSIRSLPIKSSTTTVNAKKRLFLSMKSSL